MADEQKTVSEGATPAQANTTNDWLAEADVLAIQLKAVTAANVEVRFAIGDWLNKYADRDSVYDVGEEKFGKPRKQLHDFASTARRMPAALRTFKVSFNHYRVVANNAKPDKFTHWLEHAESRRRNCEDLRLSILAESEATEKVSVVISEEAYETLQIVADMHKSTVQELAGVWLQEKVKAESAISATQPVLDLTRPSAWILNKRAEQAELEKLAQELHDAKFPKIPLEEFKRLWLNFMSTVHTVREAERVRLEAVKREQEAEKRKQAEALAEKAKQYDAGLRRCRELGLLPRAEAQMHEHFENAPEETKNKILEFAFDSACRENGERAAVNVANPSPVSVIS